MKRYLLIMVAVGFSAAMMIAESAADAVSPSVVTLATQVCSMCHGLGGRSIAPTFPLLAGQTAPYIEEQLKAFKTQSRKDPDAEAFMWGMASQLDEDTIQGLATFYAAQKPGSGVKGDPKEEERGKMIYDRGIGASKVAPCIACHGKEAQGQGAFPRLAGQHSAYLVKQLQAFRTGLRESPIMQPVAAGLNPDEMAALAAFLNALN